MKILYLDLETSPHFGATWEGYETNVLWFTKYGMVISVAWKFEGERAHVRALPDYDGYRPGKENDKKLLTEFHKVLAEADILVYQNGERFDLPYLNTRFIFHGLTPIAPRQTIDTLRIFKRHFKFPMNSLNEVCTYLGIGQKVRTDKNLWKDCLDPNLPQYHRNRAWSRMKKYNKWDVELLQQVCKRVLPFATAKPNYNVYTKNKMLCTNPLCGSPNLEKRGYRATATTRRNRYYCQDCGSWATGPALRADVILR